MNDRITIFQSRITVKDKRKIQESPVKNSNRQIRKFGITYGTYNVNWKIIRIKLSYYIPRKIIIYESVFM